MLTTQPIFGESDKKIGAYGAPLRVTAQDTPNMTVVVRAGAFFNGNNTFVDFPGGVSPTIVAPASNYQWAMITLDNLGVVNVVYGASAANPSLPAIPAGELPLAAIALSSTTTTITPSLISDIRPFVRTTDIVPDIASTLATFATVTYVNNALALKSDTTGTTGSVFTLNQGALVNQPYAELVAHRPVGASTGIRWNESLTRWEFSNDGSTYNAIGSSSALVSSFNTRTGAITLTSLDVTGALGYTPYNSSNPAGYITSVTSLAVTTALGFTPLAPSAIGTTVEAYDATILKSADIGTTVEAHDATILKSANIGVTVEAYDATILKAASIGVTVEAYDATILKSADIGTTVQANLGYTPYNATNPTGYQTAAQVASQVSAATVNLAPITSPAFLGVPELPTYLKTSLPVGIPGAIIYVSDATRTVGAGPGTATGTLAFYDGTGWIDVTTGSAVI